MTFAPTASVDLIEKLRSLRERESEEGGALALHSQSAAAAHAAHAVNEIL